MHVLHLFSNKRWTGPAEPAANLAAGLQAAGVDVTFAYSAAGAQEPHRMAGQVRNRGLVPRTDLHLPKHLRPALVLRDAGRLAKDLKARRYDLLHCHQPIDHCTAGLARTWAHARVPIVRSVYDGATLNGSWINRLAVHRWANAVCVPSGPARDDVVGRGLQPAERVHVVDGAIDGTRFDRARPLAGARTEWGLSADHVVFGVVARMQPYRRFDILFPAFRDALNAAPHARLVLIGRGTRAEEVVHKPVRQMGLGEQVHVPGYLEGDAYVAALRALDALIFLRPGSDGTCRTVREALAVGVPAIVAGEGILPWLVDDGHTGLLVDASPASVAAAIVRVATDGALRGALQAHAGRVGPARFALTRQVDTVRRLYEACTHE